MRNSPPSLTSALDPPERRALREIVARGDLAHVSGRAFLVVPMTPTMLDTLAAFEAEAADLEDEPAEAQGDDEPSMATPTWT